MFAHANPLSSLLQMRSCSRPLKLTDFVANARFRGIIVSACDLPASDFDHLLVLLRNVSAISQLHMVHAALQGCWKQSDDMFIYIYVMYCDTCV